MAVERYILTVKELHLGYMKETFGQGAVIELDTDKRQLRVDGRVFDELRDLEILKRQAMKNPDNPWIVEYSDERLAFYKGQPEPVVAPKPKPGENMQIIESDSDLIEDIDISDTKITDAARMAAESKARVEGEGMEIIRGDESVEERIARLDAEDRARNEAAKGKKKGNMDIIAKKVALKNSEPAKMEVVHDDSLGQMGGSAASALNAGNPVMSREAIEARTEETKMMAESRKREAEGNRSKVLAEQGLAGQEEFEVAPAAATAEGVVTSDTALESVEATPSEAEVLKAENATLQAQMETMQKQMATLLAAQQGGEVAPAPVATPEADVEAAVEAVEKIPVTASEGLA
jgi:hypothetical protein